MMYNGFMNCWFTHGHYYMITSHLPDGWTYEKRKDGIAVFMPDGTQKCGAKSKSGKPCMKYPIKGRLRCKIHNGGAKRGVEAPNYQGKGYSKYLPDRLRDRYDALLEDENLLDLRQNVALIDIRIQDLAELVDLDSLGDGVYRINSLIQSMDGDVIEAHKNNNPKALARFFDKWENLRDAIDKEKARYETWNDLLAANDSRRNMVKTIEDIRLKGERAVSIDQLMLVMAQIADLFDRVNRLEDNSQRRDAWRKGIGTLIDIG